MRRHPARLAAFVVRCYPRRWRERYADEVLALIDDIGIGWLGALDLARGALRERAIELDALMWGHPSEAVDDLPAVNWRRLYGMCWVILVPWKFLLRGVRLDLNRLGEITLERTRQKVRLIGLGLDEARADGGDVRA